MGDGALMKCPRCNTLTIVTSMSWFNEDEVCMDCKDDEKACPNYESARSIEEAHVKAGNTRFEGVGLQSDDRMVLAALLKKRKEIVK
ncbi:hypothetical protein ES705_20570 [subsurface metagenome]